MYYKYTEILLNHVQHSHVKRHRHSYILSNQFVRLRDVILNDKLFSNKTLKQIDHIKICMQH